MIDSSFGAAYHQRNLDPLLLHCRMLVIEEILVMLAGRTGFYHRRHNHFCLSLISDFITGKHAAYLSLQMGGDLLGNIQGKIEKLIVNN